MLQTEGKIRVLENFHGLDYVFFAKPIKEMNACCDALVEEYLSVKGALLSVCVEMYNLIGLEPAPLKEKLTSESFNKLVKQSAVMARNNSQKLVQTEQGKADIKAQLKESIAENEAIDIEEEVKEKIREKAFSLAVDSMLLTKSLSESTMLEKLDDWEGQIIEDSYKVLRDSLVESALFIIEADAIISESE